jgi:hypothetical protein
MTERNSTVFTRQPEVASPARSRVTASVAESFSKAMFVVWLTIVPINFRVGPSGRAGAETGSFASLAGAVA